MGMKLRLFICTKGNDRGIFKGQTLEVYGSLFKMTGYFISHIKTYTELHNSKSKWKEIRTLNDLTNEEKENVYVKKYFLKYIPDV